MSLEHLFDAELTYRPEMGPIATSGEGELVGGGEGQVEGGRLRGALRWTLFEGGGDLVCTMHPTLAIDTDDGATVSVEGQGYARRARRTDQRWRVAATLLFHATDGRYKWLDGALGVWEGEFDAERHTARYHAYLQLGSDSEHAEGTPAHPLDPHPHTPPEPWQSP